LLSGFVISTSYSDQLLPRKRHGEEVFSVNNNLLLQKVRVLQSEYSRSVAAEQ